MRAVVALILVLGLSVAEAKGASRREERAVEAVEVELEEARLTIGAQRVEAYGAAADNIAAVLAAWPETRSRRDLELQYAEALGQASRDAEAAEAWMVVATTGDPAGAEEARRNRLACLIQVMKEAIDPTTGREVGIAVESVRTTPFGRQVTVYQMSDAQRVLIAEIEAWEAEPHAEPYGGTVTRLPSIAGALFHRLGRYEEARVWWRRALIGKIWWLPAMPLLEGYAAEGDLEGLRRAGDELTAQSDAADGGRRGSPLRVEYATFIRDRDPAAALIEYLAFIEDHPDDPRMIQVVLFAAALQPDPATKIETLRSFVTRYPASSSTPGLNLRLGGLLAQAGDYAGAIDTFARIYQVAPSLSEASMAMELEALLRAATGDHAGAAKVWEQYARAWPHAGEKAARAGEAWQRVGDRAALTYYLAAPVPPRANEAIAMLVARAEVQTRLKDKAAADSWAAAERRFDEAVVAKEAVGERVRGALAEHALIGLRAQLVALRALKFGRDVELLTHRAPEPVAAIQAEVVRITARYVELNSALDALTLQGEAYLAVAEFAQGLRWPEESRAEDPEMVHSLIDEQFVLPFTDRARQVFEQVLHKARDERRWPHAADRALAHLQDLSPPQFPRTPAESGPRTTAIPGPPSRAQTAAAALDDGDLDLATFLTSPALDSAVSEGPGIDAVRGALALRQGDRRAGLALLQSAPGDPPSLRQLGAYYLQNHDFSGAQRAYAAAIDKLPNDPDLHLGLGIAERNLGNFDSARQAYQRAATLDPNWPAPWRNLAILEAGYLHNFDAAAVALGRYRAAGGTESLDEWVQEMRYRAEERRRPD